MSATPDPVREIGSRLELFVDDYLIGELRNVRLQLGRPVAREVSLRYDRPWEGRLSGYPTVIRDGDVYRLYYRGMPEGVSDGQGACACYAESRDGVRFVRPELDLYPAPGGGPNNLILPFGSLESANFAPFLDTRPGAPHEERLKAVGGVRTRKLREDYGYGGLYGLVSEDGVHWRRVQEEPIIGPDAGCKFDTHNSVFWSESEERYVCYVRSLREEGERRYRWISRAVSEDFVNWSEPEPMEFGDAPLEELYTNGAQPYSRAPHIYIFLAARFCDGRRALTDEQAASLQLAHPAHAKNCADGVLLSSRGGLHADRTFLEAFVRPAIGYENWSSRTNYPAMGVVPTGEAELSFYVNSHYSQPSAHIRRYTIRPDGFASVNAPYAGGDLVTRPLRFEGSRLVLNYATSAAGSLLAAVEDPDGGAIPGFGLEDCEEILGNEIERVVRWRAGADVSALAGRAVRLRFAMNDADLYSLRFRP